MSWWVYRIFRSKGFPQLPAGTHARLPWGSWLQRRWNICKEEQQLHILAESQGNHVSFTSGCIPRQLRHGATLELPFRGFDSPMGLQKLLWCDVSFSSRSPRKSHTKLAKERPWWNIASLSTFPCAIFFCKIAEMAGSSTWLEIFPFPWIFAQRTRNSSWSRCWSSSENLPWPDGCGFC